MDILNKIKKEKEDNRNYYFYIDTNGLPTPDSYNEDGKNVEVFIEQRPDPKLTKVSIDGMSDIHPKLKKVLEFLIELDYKLEDANLRLDNNPKTTLKDFLKQCDNNHKLPEFLYHGTSSNKAKDILENGLKPRKKTNIKPQYMTKSSGESNPELVYLCTYGTLGSAKFAARQSASNDGSKAVILKINTNDLFLSDLMPDEDSNKKYWEDSIKTLGSIGYKNIISAPNIKIENNLTRSLNIKFNKNRF
jgi:hypothetical protein